LTAAAGVPVGCPGIGVEAAAGDVGAAPVVGVVGAPLEQALASSPSTTAKLRRECLEPSTWGASNGEWLCSAHATAGLYNL
jgi:hypothetical protein